MVGSFLYGESTSFSFINPPSSAQWSFEANQAINVKFKNENVLVGILSYDILPTFQSDTVIIFPFTTVERHYDIFDYTPINWRFSLFSPQDASFIACEAIWDSFTPDRPNY